MNVKLRLSGLLYFSGLGRESKQPLNLIKWIFIYLFSSMSCLVFYTPQFFFFFTFLFCCDSYEGLKIPPNGADQYDTGNKID